LLDAIAHLTQVVHRYSALSKESLGLYLDACKVQHLKKGQLLYRIGEIPTSFAFIHQGLMRSYVVDERGNEFNKNFFAEGRFPGCMSALLQGTPTLLAIEALEDCVLIEIDFKLFRSALLTKPDLMIYQINYLETHWLLEKEQKEIEYLQFDAKQRYLAFLDTHKAIISRLTQYHIASYLGITPTQLSRVRKDLK